MQLHVFADDGDLRRAGRMLQPVDHLAPVAEVAFALQPEALDHEVAEPTLLEGQRHFVDSRGRLHGDDRLRLHIAEEGDFVA